MGKRSKGEKVKKSISPFPGETHYLLDILPSIGGSAKRRCRLSDGGVGALGTLGVKGEVEIAGSGEKRASICLLRVLPTLKFPVTHSRSSF